MTSPFTTNEIRKAIEGYIGCALWASSDGEGRYYDGPGFALSDDARVQLAGGITAFLNANIDLCALAIGQRGYNAARLGHDLWLAQNGHGAGYWDREELEIPDDTGCRTVGHSLMVAAKAAGEVCLYDHEGIVEVG